MRAACASRPYFLRIYCRKSDTAHAQNVGRGLDGARQTEVRGSGQCIHPYSTSYSKGVTAVHMCGSAVASPALSN